MSIPITEYVTYNLDGITFCLPERYIPNGFLGSGGCGVVIKACDKIEKKDVAIKKLNNPFYQPILAKRAYREFVLSQIVNHKNVIRLLDAFTPQNSYKNFHEIYFVSEYVKFSLRHIISQRERLFYKDGGGRNISYLMYQLLCGINHLHKAGIIHRDITPSNILVNEHFILKIIDLGLARQMPENKQFLSGYVVMRYYRAPEVVLNVVYDEKVDVWSVGCILAELLIGKILFVGKDHIDQWIKIIEILGSPKQDFLRRLPESIRRFLNKIRYHEGILLAEIFNDNVFPPMSEKMKPRKPYCTAANGRDFLSKLLVIDPYKRISIEEALKHPYVEEKHEEGELDAEPRPELTYNGDIDNMVLKADQWKRIVHIVSYPIKKRRMYKGG